MRLLGVSGADGPCVPSLQPGTVAIPLELFLHYVSILAVVERMPISTHQQPERFRIARTVQITVHDGTSLHSCSVCQTLVLDFGEKDDAWLARFFPSINSKSLQIIAKRELGHEFPLQIPSNEIIFDFSIKEIQDTTTSYLLYQDLTSYNIDSDENSLLSGEFEGPFFRFRVTDVSERIEPWANDSNRSDNTHKFQVNFFFF